MQFSRTPALYGWMPRMFDPHSTPSEEVRFAVREGRLATEILADLRRTPDFGAGAVELRYTAGRQSSAIQKSDCSLAAPKLPLATLPTFARSVITPSIPFINL